MTEPSKNEPEVSYCELGAVPKMMWQCPTCLKVKETFSMDLINPIGQGGELEWKCECGHEGVLARRRMATNTQSRAERRRLSRLALKQKKVKR